MAVLTVDLPDEAATRRFGADLALSLKPGDCVALSGPLGAGKSTLARALIRAVADDPDLDVPSPTFTLVQAYELRFPVWHFDFYRLGDPDEVAELGLDEALAGGVALIEWPEKAEEALPQDRLVIRFDDGNGGRRLSISASEPVMARVRRTLLIRDFLTRFARGDAERRYLIGDASPRAYERIRPVAGPDFILMNAPRLPKGPILRDGKPYTELAHIAEDVRPFVAIDGFLRSRGLTAPEIIACDLEEGLVLLEDLGREGVLDADGRPIEERYAVTIDALARLHDEPPPGSLPLPDGGRHIVPPFDRVAMAIEVELVLEWYVPWRTGAPIADADRKQFGEVWATLIDHAQRAEQNVLLRDVHSPNLFWLPRHRDEARIGMIDFQDAMIGPTAYDVASLVQDARVTIDPDVADRLVERYVVARTARSGRFDGESFRAALAIMQSQRATKILGLFVRLKLRDGKDGYLRHIPRIERYLAASLRHELLHPLRDFYRRVGILSNES